MFALFQQEKSEPTWLDRASTEAFEIAKNCLCRNQIKQKLKIGTLPIYRSHRTKVQYIQSLDESA